MATEAQIAANRRNAALSTGPKSVEGKGKSRLNAATHGMTAQLPGVAAAVADRFEARRAAWAKQYRPTDPTGDWMLDRLVTTSFQIEQCEEAFQAALIEQKSRAELSWDLDGKAEAATLFAKLERRPMATAAQLETSLYGCDALLTAWTGLAAAIEANGTLDEAQVTLALNLLGVDPLLRSGRTILDGPVEAETESHRRDFIADEIDRLKEMREASLTPLDDLRRRITVSGGAVFDSKAVRLILRYERDAFRRFHGAIRDLRHPQSETAAVPTPADETKPISAAKPEKPAVSEPSEPPLDVTGIRPGLVEAIRRAMAKDEQTRLPSEQPLTFEEIYASMAKQGMTDPH